VQAFVVAAGDRPPDQRARVGLPEQAQSKQRSVFGSLVNAFTNFPDVKGDAREKYGR
jgi:hypothetical protein